MRGPIRRKWRPPLALVIGGTLAAVLLLPVLGVGYFRLAGNVLGWAETTWLIGWVAVIATALLGFLLWRLVLQPVYALTAHANAVKDGRSDAPLPPHFGTPEITALGQAVHEMGTTLQNREAGIRAYSDHVTHELKSPLTSLTAAAELLEDDLPADDRAALIATIRDSAAQMQAQLEALRRLAAARVPLGRGPVDISAVLPALRAQTPLTVTLGGVGQVPLAADTLLAVLVHLAQNAAAHGADRLDLTLAPDALRIADNGSGIAPGNAARIFDPFFTTRRAVGGTGMGLSIVRSMVQSAGAEIALVPAPTGTCFEIAF